MPYETPLHHPTGRVANNSSFQHDSSQRMRMNTSSSLYQKQEEPPKPFRQTHVQRPTMICQNSASNVYQTAPAQTIFTNVNENVIGYHSHNNFGNGGAVAMNSVMCDNNVGGVYANYTTQTAGPNYPMVVRPQQQQQMDMNLLNSMQSNAIHPNMSYQPNASQPMYMSIPSQCDPSFRPLILIPSSYDQNQSATQHHKRLKPNSEFGNQYELLNQNFTVIDAPTIVLRPEGQMNNFSVISGPVFVTGKQHQSSNIVRRGANSYTVYTQDPVHILENKHVDPFADFRRPLTAYNFFFSAERDLILKILDRADKISANNAEVKSVETIATVTCTTEAESESVLESTPNETSSNISNLASMDEEIAHFLKIISETPFSDEEIAQHDESAVAKAKLLLNVHMEADRVKKPHRKQHGKISFQTLGKLIGIRWRDSTPERKGIYFDLARKDAERFKAQVRQAVPTVASLSQNVSLYK